MVNASSWYLIYETTLCRIPNYGTSYDLSFGNFTSHFDQDAGTGYERRDRRLP
jgi:hypothetical protein